MITTLDRYLVRRLVVALLRALIVLVALYILIDLLSYRKNVIDRHDVPWGIVFEYYGAQLPRVIIEYAASFALLVSVLLVLGDTAQNNESLAVFAGGVSLFRFLRAPMIVALFYALGIFGLQEGVASQTTARALQIDHSYFSRNPESQRDAVSWTLLRDAEQTDRVWTCHVMKFNRIALTGEGVLLYALMPDFHYQIQARRIWWDENKSQWNLERGVWQVYDTQNNLLTEHRRITLEPAPFIDTPDELFSLSRRANTKTIVELRRDILDAEKRNIQVHAHWVDYHIKYAQPMLCFIMFWLAAPFAMRLRRGGLAISFGASIAMALGYMLIFFISTGLGRLGVFHPAFAAWLPNILFLGTGLVLFYRTPT